MRHHTKSCLDNIVDTCTGDDGGIKFINLRSLIEHLDTKASEGDQAAEEVINVVKRFSNLINAANK
jgi:hypothetical protein